MIKTFCHVCSKYRKSKNPKISYIFKKKNTLCLSAVYSKCGHESKKKLKKKNQLKY